MGVLAWYGRMREHNDERGLKLALLPCSRKAVNTGGNAERKNENAYQILNTHWLAVPPPEAVCINMNAAHQIYPNGRAVQPSGQCF